MGVKKSMFLKESQKPFIITGLQQPAGVSNVLKPVTLLQELTTLFFFSQNNRLLLHVVREIGIVRPGQHSWILKNTCVHVQLL